MNNGDVIEWERFQAYNERWMMDVFIEWWCRDWRQCSMCRGDLSYPCYWYKSYEMICAQCVPWDDIQLTHYHTLPHNHRIYGTYYTHYYMVVGNHVHVEKL